MKINKNILLSFGLVTCLSGIQVLHAAVSETEAARLGKDLTPLGATKAGNKAGTIPAWTGGITAPPAGYQKGAHHPDPFAADKVLFTITAANADTYKDNLSAGQIALLKKYPTHKMNVYPTRRSSAFPQRIYDATKKNAATASLYKGGDSVDNAIIGIPFPIPKNGQEVIWNHLLRFRGETVQRHVTQASPTASGQYTLVKFDDEFDFPYVKPGATLESLNNILLYFKQEVQSPARLAGSVLLVHETFNQVKEPRSAWSYNPGQRRVRRAPNVAYDNPGTASDGLRTNDQFDMFNGATDRYNWKLIGKQELYVPYNAYKLHSDKLKYSDILKPGHINPDHSRYELHRVWVVEATLKEGTSHIYSKRTLYFDEDSWQILVVDQYDRRNQIWRVSEGHVINYYDMPLLWTTLEVHHDLQSGRYIALGLDNEEKMYDFSIKRTVSDYTPSSLRRAGRR